MNQHSIIMTIYGFKNFNNYYNRKLKGQEYTNISDFMDAFGDFSYIQTDTYGNFNEKDGVSTSQVLGAQDNPYNGDCDYLLVCYDNNTIDSRWFVVDQDKNMYGQFTCSLYRDVIADNWESIKDAPMFIEKATLSDDDPLIFNQENITTNQIKKEEILLQDSSKMGWIVGYIAKSYDGSNPLSITVDAVADYTIANESDLASTIGAARNTTYSILRSSTYTFYLYTSQTAAGHTYNNKVKYTVNNAGNVTMSIASQPSTIPSGAWTFNGAPATLSGYISSAINKTALDNSVKYSYSTYNNADDYQYAIRSNDGKIVYVTSGNTYLKVNASFDNSNTTRDITTGGVHNTLANQLSGITHTGTDIEASVVTNDDTGIYTTTEISMGTYSVTLGNVNDRIHCKDVFDMFVIPYPMFKENGEGYDDTVYDSVIIKNSSDNTWTDFSFTAYGALNIAQGIAEQLGSNLYDIQLLPYCPITGVSFGHSGNNRTMDIKTTDAKRYKLVKDANSSNKGIIIFSASNKGTFNITAENLPTLYSASNVKIVNQTQISRLSSPNYTAQFDFNVARNRGVSSFNVDYTYLPYRPYIHIAPVWSANGIYGKDFNDAKGLICGGDFSISYLSDAWVNYQVQNKNFQDIFDRGTQNLETNYKYQRIQSIAGAVTGSLTGGVAGASAGKFIGGTVAGAVGAGIGTVASGVGGLLDLKIQKELHNEAMDYRQDLFDMQLDNIKALPDTLTKVTAINENNKIFPFVEIYDCTDREKEAVANKIAWNGMTVGVIGRISDYLDNSWSYGDITDKGYIKGQVIRLDGIADDTHMLNAIADELNKGVYTK